MDKVNFNPFAEILMEDFLRQSGYIGDAFKLLVADFLCQNTAVIGLEVTAQSVSDMTVYVKPGRIYQSGQQGQLTVNLDPALTITAAHPQYDRIDRICAQYKETPDTPETRNVMIDTVSRQVTQKSVMTRIAGTIDFMVVNGIAAPGPAAPTVPDGWVSLAQVKVRANITSVLQTDITDERPTLKSLMNHAHSGGIDGAQVDYTSLKNKPTIPDLSTLTASGIPNDPIGTLGTATVQATLAALLTTINNKPVGNVGRNMLITGPKDGNGNPSALYSDLASGIATLKATTKLTFAAGLDDNGAPKDYPVNVLADVTTTLGAADVNTIPLRYTDDLCNGGTAISGGDYSGRAASNAFDNDSATFWGSSQVSANQLGVSYIGYNFGTTKAIIRIKFSAYTATINNVTSVKVQYSSNGTTWFDACTTSVDSSISAINYISVPAVGAFQYWRLLANSNLTSTASWSIFEIEMMEALQTHYLYADYLDGVVNLVSSKNAPRKPSQSKTVFVDGYYTADLCTGGTAIESGHNNSYVAANAFDNSAATMWASAQASANQLGVSAIGYNFASAKKIKRINLTHNNDINHAMPTLKVQNSQDGNAWNDVQTFTGLTKGANVLDITTPTAAPYWRLLAMSNLSDTYAWDVTEIEMMEYVEPTTITIGEDLLYSDNLCVSVAAISGGDLTTSVVKENVFNGQTAAPGWSSSQLGTAISGVAYIGCNFGVARSIRKIKLWQSTGGGAINSVKVQKSTDGTIWNDVLTAPLVPGYNEISLPENTAGSFLRLLANANLAATYSWDVFEVEMYELSTDVYYYDPEVGKSHHYDGNAWADVTRVYIGSADVDSSGKIVAVYPDPYNLPRINVRDAQDIHEPVALGQLSAILDMPGLVEIPTDTGESLILQWFFGPADIVPDGAGATVVNFYYSFPKACIAVIPITMLPSVGNEHTTYQVLTWSKDNVSIYRQLFSTGGYLTGGKPLIIALGK